jgi:F-type H+-transporting ATPase subunit delta
LSRVAIRYSKALFELALEQELIEDVRSDLEMIQDVCTENPEFQQTLNNPLIEEKVKSKVLKELFETKVTPLTFKFLQLLSRKRRSGFLLEMIDNYLQRVLDHQGILSCLLISSGPVETDQIEAIKSRIEAMTDKSVIFSHQIDNSMIGGFIVKIKDTVIDLSIKTQLEKMRRQLLHR